MSLYLSGSSKARGFVLVMTMWIMLAIAIAAAYFSERVQASLQLAARQQNLADGLVSASNAKAELLFRLATTPMTQAGLGQGPNLVSLDNRPYELDRSVVRLQDGRGLLNLNAFGDEQMSRLLTALGVPAAQHASLIDALRDYTDNDNLRRLNGAEAPDYAAKGLPPPRNLPLVSPMELRRVLGWQSLDIVRGDGRLLELTTVGQSLAINPNTAPKEVLMALPGVDEPMARTLVDRRALGVVDIGLMERLLGASMAVVPSPVIAFPASNLRLTIAAPGLPWLLRYNVQLTPRSTTSPWQVTYFYRLERSAATDRPVNAEEIAKLPPRDTLPAASTLQAPN